MCYTAISISITSITSADQLSCWPLSPNPDLAFEMQERSEKPGLSINSWWGKESGRWGLVTSVWRLSHLIVLLSPLSGLQLGSGERTEPTVQGTRTVTGNMARTSSQSLMVQRRLFARPQEMTIDSNPGCVLFPVSSFPLWPCDRCYQPYKRRTIYIQNYTVPL